MYACDAKKIVEDLYSDGFNHEYAFIEFIRGLSDR